MGGSSSKTDEKTSTTDNKGLLNGNLINNGQIVKEIDSDLIDIEKVLYILLIILLIKLVLTMFKMYMKNQKKQQLRNQRLDSIIIPRNAV